MRNSTSRSQASTKSLMNLSIFGAALLLGTQPVHADSEATHKSVKKMDASQVQKSVVHEHYEEGKAEPSFS